jgi:hypothetical protein
VRRLLPALLAVAIVLAASPALADTPAVPILDDPRGALLKDFSGSPATAQPLPRQSIPRHPSMAPNERSNLHNDAYQTDTYNTPGPLGHRLTVSSAAYGIQDCASILFDSHGRIVTTCVGIDHPTLRLLNPKTLATIAEYNLPRRPLSLQFDPNNFAGGGYFYLDQHDRAVVTTYDMHLLVLEPSGSSFVVRRTVDLSRATQGSFVQSALPAWSGNIWFITQSGVVGFVDRANAVHWRKLPAGETIANSFAVDESGGVFVASTHALYRFDEVAGQPHVTWRQAYDRGTRQKPGQVSQGTGTTPTLIGPANGPGGGYVAITDNADPQLNVVVWRRGKAGPGPLVCKQPVFPKGQSADENSLIAVPGGGLIAENNYGYTGPVRIGRIADTTPGLVRINVDYTHRRCAIAWQNTVDRIPTAVTKASLGSGLIYSYTHPAASELEWSGTALPAALAPDAFYLTAFSLRTGKRVWRKYVGAGPGWNNHWAAVTIGPDSTFYIGTLAGMVRVADGQP